MSEKEEVKEEKEQKKSGNTFVVVFFALLMIGLSVACGWFANSYFSSMNNKSSERQEESKAEWKSLGTDISKVEVVYDAIKDYIYVQNRPNGGLSFKNRDVMRVLITQIKESDLNNISKDEFSGKANLSYDRAKAILEKCFGKNFEIPTEVTYCDNKNNCSIGSDFNYYGYATISRYDANTKSFSISWNVGGLGVGGAAYLPESQLRKIQNVYEKDNEIKVVEKVIYANLISCDVGDACHFDIYSDYQQTSQIGKIDRSDAEDYSNKNYANEFSDKASTLTSLYRKAEDGSYYFVSSEISG